MDRFAKYKAITGSLRSQVCDLELVTRLTLPNGTVSEITDVRRALCKRATRKGNTTSLEFVDIDRSALQQLFPFETFTTADFPELFVDHVGKRVPQGVGTVQRVPLAYIHKSGGQFIYAGHKVLAGATGVFLTVYRGTTPGQGSVVSPTEYSFTTMAAPSGYTVWCIVFAKEQVDFNGRPYLIEADLSLPGSRTPSDEISRILQAYGLTIDAASFAAAAAADTAAGFLVDPLYGDPGRTGNATIEDLLRVARGWLTQTSTGAWAIVQDVAKASSAQFDTNAASDLIELTEYGDNDVPKTVTGQYRPKTSGKEDYTGQLQRTVGGASGDRQLKWPYVWDHTVADKLMSYWSKRLVKPIGKGRVFAQQLGNGSVITITDAVQYVGTKDFILSGVTRPADANLLTLREYDAAVYTYAPGTLPADATSGYSADFSFTNPLAPTSQALVSNGTSADTDGKVTAFQKVHASPPANANWISLWAQLTDTTTNEQYTQQLFFNAGTGFYEAVFSGLRPNRIHSIIFWARNSNGVDGATATVANFTSANFTTALGTPVVSLTQKQSFEINIDFTAIADVAGQPKFRRYVLFENVGGAGYNEVQRTPDRTLKRTVVHGTSYQYKARSEDVNGNESADSGSVSIVPAAVVNDNWIAPGGVGHPSIGPGAVNQGQQITSTASASGTVGGNGYVSVGGGASSAYSYAPGLTVGGVGGIGQLALLGTPASTQFIYYIHNTDPSSQSYDAQWRQVSP